MHQSIADIAERADLPLDGNLFSPTLRRDLTDLNRQFLSLGLDAVHSEDPRFRLPATIRSLVSGIDAEERRVVAQCPFALFELILPPPDAASLWTHNRVGDQPQPAAQVTASVRSHSFAHSVLALARSLAASLPLSIPLSLGLSGKAETQLVELRPSELASLAGWPGLIRPRWPGNPRVWAVMTEAARQNTDDALQWAHCVGLCLLGTETRPGGAGERSPHGAR
jgi:hypothetical protein